MSWFSKFVATSKAGAHAELDKLHTIPTEVRDAYKAVISAFHLPKGTALSIETQGHLADNQAQGCSASMTITQLAHAAEPEAATTTEEPPAAA